MSIPGDALASRRSTVRLIWISLTLSTAVVTGFGIALPLYILPQPMLPGQAGDFLRLYFFIAALAVGTFVIWWRRRFLTVEALLANAPTPDVLLMRFQTVLLVAWAATEGIAIFGMVAAIVSADPRMALMLGGVAVLLQLLVLRPPTDVLDEALRRLRLGAR
jgi:hypothetical protein